MPNIRGLLIDLDGVLYIDDSPIPGAIEAVKWCKNNGYAVRFLTNTSTRPRMQLCSKLFAMGFDIEEFEIFSAPYAARLYLESRPKRKCKFIVEATVMSDFLMLNDTSEETTHIVIGDSEVNGITSYSTNCLMMCSTALKLSLSTRIAFGRPQMGFNWILAHLLRRWNMRQKARLL